MYSHEAEKLRIDKVSKGYDVGSAISILYLQQQNEQLMLECDSKAALIEALQEQVVSLGGTPVKHTWLDKPWTEQKCPIEDFV